MSAPCQSAPEAISSIVIKSLQISPDGATPQPPKPVRPCLPQAGEYICCATGSEPCPNRPHYYYDNLPDCCPTDYTCSYPFAKTGTTVRCYLVFLTSS